MRYLRVVQKISNSCWHGNEIRILRLLASIVPGGTISAFGSGEEMIGSILVVTLDRQPRRWRRVMAYQAASKGRLDHAGAGDDSEPIRAQRIQRD